MKLTCLLALTLVAPFALLLDVPAVQGETIQISSGSCAAVAYSPSSRRYHYAYNYRSRAEAEAAALRGLAASDGRIAGWVRGGFFALAASDDGKWRTGWSYGNGASNTQAALYALRDFGLLDDNPHIVVCLSSDGQYVYKR